MLNVYDTHARWSLVEDEHDVEPKELSLMTDNPNPQKCHQTRKAL